MSESQDPVPAPEPVSAPASPSAPAPEPTSVPSSTPGNRGRINRTVIGINVVIQVLLVFFIVVVANAVAYRHYKRWDLSHNMNYSLSSKTKNLLSHLDQPVHATVFFPQAQMLSKDVGGL